MSILFKGREVSASPQQMGVGRLLYSWRTALQQAILALDDIWRTPLASLMTILVLGLSLTLPASLYVVVKNVQSVNYGWQNAAEISLFLKANLSDTSRASLVQKLALYPEIAEVKLVTADQALNEFKSLSGFGQALNYLDENPLPDVVLVTPQPQHKKPEAARALLDKLQTLPEVELGKMDIEWLERLHAILSLLKQSVTTVAALLLCSVILIIGNTIRLSILSKKEEIEVMKLVGATDAFIHRPFLLTGLWYGVVGGVIAWLAVGLMSVWMEGAVSQVAGVYNSQFQLTGLDVIEVLLMFGLAIGLGLAGSYFSVMRYIKDIEPEMN